MGSKSTPTSPVKGVRMSSLAIDMSVAIEGVWQDFGPYRMKVAQANGATNPQFQAVFEKHMRPLMPALELAGGSKGLGGGTVSPEVERRSRAALHRIYAEAIVKDWDGLLDDSDKPIPYSPEACIKLFEANPKTFDVVRAFSEGEIAFRAEQVQAVAGNSQPTSSTG